MKRVRVYKKVTDMKVLRNRQVWIRLNNIQVDKGGKVIRNNKYITKDGNVRNFSTFNSVN